MANVSIPEVNMLKIISTHAVFVPINLSIKLGFVFVNGPRETYFVNEPRNMEFSQQFYFLDKEPFGNGRISCRIFVSAKRHIQ